MTRTSVVLGPALATVLLALASAPVRWRPRLGGRQADRLDPLRQGLCPRQQERRGEVGGARSGADALVVRAAVTNVVVAHEVIAGVECFAIRAAYP